MFGFLDAGARQLSAARKVLTHLAETCDIPVAVRLWDGSTVPLGQGAAETGLAIALRSPGVIGALLRRPSLDHLLRQYATGGIDFLGGDLIAFGEALRSAKQKVKLKHLKKSLLLKAAVPFLFARAERKEVQHAYAGDCDGHNTATRNNKDYIQFHYDLGNDFYKLFLDPEMVYSCGYFTDWNNTLEQAQRDKLEMICRKLRLSPGEKFLDIGCGWGGLICHAAQQHGVQAHGVTLSQEQYDYVREKIARLGLQDRVTVALCDYRELEGSYDKIASIGMFEHVGIANLPTYFRKLYSLLRDRGILLNHGISRRAKPVSKKSRKKRAEYQLVAKYIFPGGELDDIGHTVNVMESSQFEVHDVEGWREHYMQTTAHWCRRLMANREAAIQEVGPERYRLWTAYLSIVSFGFKDGSIQIFQVVSSKRASKGRAELPPTRADLYGPRSNATARKVACADQF
ncbi:MAG TPA: cyclopropane-fatty-acyl-phospholipid synthase family protein [Planctomycetaceae bacterium]|nr:cyclopropane-fatty-acyl-phospholipid synthase family protein [Planctomycetaceae bacterium]